MASQIDDCEILVHVDAPALAANDAGYRQLAHAYLAFLPDATTHLPEIDSSHVRDRSKDPSETTNDVPILDRARLLADQDGAPPAIIESQDLSFEGAIDNRNSPHWRVESKSVHDEGLVIPSSLPPVSSSPPSEIADSYPMPAVVSYTSPSRLLRQWTTPRPTISSTSEASKDVLPPQRTDHTPSQHLSQRDDQQLASSEDHATNSQHVSLTNPSSNASIKKRQRQDESTDDVGADITHVTASDRDQPSRPTPSNRSESEPLLSKRSKTSHNNSSLHTELKPLSRSVSDTTPRRRECPLDTLPLQVWSKSPPVGVEDVVPSDFISQALTKLHRQLSSRYRPVASREITPFERGYWLVDTTTWNLDTHFKFWTFLEPYVLNGHAGWGVWCRTDEARRYVRFYCWGHVVKHIYLLLYCASDRHLKYTGADWMDGGGEMVLRVPPLAKTV